MLDSKKTFLKPRKKLPVYADFPMASPPNYNTSVVERKRETNFNAYLYSLAIYPEWPRLNRVPSPDNYGSIIVHIDSVFTHQRFRNHMKHSQKTWRWRDYYDTILQEPFRMNYVWVLRAAKEYGLEVIGLSTTPVQHAEAVRTYLMRHKVLTLFKSLDFVEKPWSSESRYLAFRFHVERNSFNPVYFLYDRTQYPKIKQHTVTLDY